MELSLVICTYQRPGPLKNLLEALALQDRPPDQTLVVDASLDDASERVAREVMISGGLPGLEYRRAGPEERGLTRQRNLGIGLAGGAIIAFLDDDTIPEPGYCRELLACFTRHPEAAAAGGYITNEEAWRRADPASSRSWAVYRRGSWERREDYRWRLRAALGLVPWENPGWLPPSGHGRPVSYLPPDGEDYEVEFVMGGASAWRREIFEKHRFSPYLEGYGLYEDLDLCLRASADGRLFQCTRARLAHHHAGSGRPRAFRYGEMVTRNGWRVWRTRWPEPAWLDRARWWLISVFLLLCRLGDAVRGPRRGQALAEAAGRAWGLVRVLWSRPPLPAAESGARTLLVVSHVCHYEWEGRTYAYAPYARELDIWADLFPRVLVAAPLRRKPPPAQASVLRRGNIQVAAQREVGGLSLLAKAAALPSILWSLHRVMSQADAIHVRCPSNLGLLGAALAPFYSRRLVAKHAGQWNGYPGEGLSGKMQRWILGSSWWRGPVLVYGRWPNQPAHVVPFFTSMLNSAQIKRARAAAAARAAREGEALRVLYVGRLAPEKNVDVLLEALSLLKRGGTALRCEIVGDGVQRPSLEALAEREGLGESVFFFGAVPLESVLDFYERNDVLVLASEVEGWPKAVAEAMAFGLVCIGSDRGFVSHLLGEGRGILVQPGDAQGLAEAIAGVGRAPRDFEPMRRRAAAWAQRYRLEDLKESIRALLEESWGKA
ncbi:MAG: glycosyltransferase [Elusimicrobia bacterium]|nr:glycosyltransferase [Elusimicrobiota bacterium]